MNPTSVFQENYLREKRLDFIRAHQIAFDVEPLFPLPLFEDLVSNLQGSYALEQSCKIESDILHAGRFSSSTEYLDIRLYSSTRDCKY